MIATVLVVVFTHNLAFGVIVGVLIAALNFATKVARLMAVSSTRSGDCRHYAVTGQVFFASADRFVRSFDVQEDLEKVVIDVTHAHFWDITSVNALDRVVVKFRRTGADVEIRGMNEATKTVVDRFGVHDKPEEVEKVFGGH
jgi:SulP family sulfate permease